MFGQQNQQQTTAGVFGAAPQLGQSTGGFSFGAGSGTGAASSAPASGFSFSAPTQPCKVNIEQEFLLKISPPVTDFVVTDCFMGSLTRS